MTTTLRITLPLEPGAKTCEGCPRLDDADEDEQPFCDLLKRSARFNLERLPECLAAEREIVRDDWELYLPGHTMPITVQEKPSIGLRRALGARVVHVTRYRRPR